MRTDTRTLKAKIADRDAKRVVATIEQAAIQALCETHAYGPASPSVRRCDAPALRTV